ncbi:MAG: valine--tRNA ligase, partial [Bacteroidota bacterium]|nr:valine--tRNA ligase [Bacteroidota bacterium]
MHDIEQHAHTIETAYNPADVEDRWYAFWEERKLFHAEPDLSREPYTIVIPPPNITGMLTMGHVLNNTLQDIFIRWNRLLGKHACWIPGTDHAGIATQTVVEKELFAREGLTRHDLGREAFVERVWQWRETYGDIILRQLRKLGVACDWDRLVFTLDPGLSRAVTEAFVRLYRKGLIYRGKRIINWDPVARTALSDEEVDHREQTGKLYYIRYPLLDDGSGIGREHIVVATTRPETMLGDTAVAVHPSDDRYRRFIGRKVLLPLMNREIPVIADEYVDPAFGTGAVKITPAHDPNDFEVGIRHGLPQLNVMNPDATINENGGPYVGLDRFAARERIVADLAASGLLERVEEHAHAVGYSYRTHVPVEPFLSDQWFVRMKPLAEPALQAVRDGHVRFSPERWYKVYEHWMTNIRDWTISRQLWWGHRIPVYFCDACGWTDALAEAPERCPSCGSPDLRQDEDVLDTWFSSWLWPFSVHHWPKDSLDLRYFYPTSLLVTGPDIIFFWVARMIMAGLEFMRDIPLPDGSLRTSVRDLVPFRDVYFTSIIRDEKGRKMSKSLGNSPDPLDVIREYGADALRFTVVSLAPLGQDVLFSTSKCELGRNFANKLWNAARFLLLHRAALERDER